MQLKVTYEEVKEGRDNVVKFDTFMYDDFIQVDVFHKGSIQNNSKLGKAFLNLYDLKCQMLTDSANK